MYCRNGIWVWAVKGASLSIGVASLRYMGDWIFESSSKQRGKFWQSGSYLIWYNYSLRRA
jgi:hypothetical protein